MVVAYELMFTVDGDGFYLEDMILVKNDGYELLTPGLPYTAREIEAVMATRAAPHPASIDATRDRTLRTFSSAPRWSRVRTRCCRGQSTLQ
jgi:hypothetical protein